MKYLSFAEVILVAAVVVLAAWFRTHDLGTNPPGIFRDEAEKALNGWALARTGQFFEFAPGLDGAPTVRWRSWPLFVDVYGVETSSIYQLALMAFARGNAPPSPFQFRLPAAMAGTLSVLALYLLLRMAWSAPIAIISALFLAISPWSILFSRWALQGSFIPLFMTFAAGGFLLAQRRHPAWLLLGAAGLGLAFYTYSGARPFVLAFALTAVCLHFRFFLDAKKWKWAVASSVLFAVLILPVIYFMFSSGGTARFERISVFAGDRSFTETLGAITRNYAVHYSPSFLFLHGDPQMRHSVASFGVLYHIEFFFALAGLLLVFKNRLPERWLILAWVLLFPVGAMLTDPREMPHALRSIVALPLPQILAGYGVVACFELDKKRLERKNKRKSGLYVACVVVAGFIFLSAGAFAIDLLKFYPTYSATAWEAGFGEALQAARDDAGEDAIFVSGNIALAPYLVLYYDGTAPEQLRREGWAALKVNLLPPIDRFESVWPFFPPGAVLLAVPQDDLRGIAFPTHIIHPPGGTQAEREQLAPMYVVYKK